MYMAIIEPSAALSMSEKMSKIREGGHLGGHLDGHLGNEKCVMD